MRRLVGTLRHGGGSEGADGVPHQESQEPSAARSSCCAASIKLANQLQSSLELDAIVHVIATALSETFGFREAAVYLREAGGEFPVARHGRRVPRVRPARCSSARCPQARLGRSSSSRSTRSARPTSSTTAGTSGPRSSSTTCRRSTSGPRRADEWHQRRRPASCRSTTRTASSWACSTCTTRPTAPLPTLELVKSLEVFATHAAVAIENARQYEAARGTTSAQLEAQLDLRHAILELERRAALDARPARGLRAHRDAAQGDRRLRRHGDPARRRGGAASSTAASPTDDATSSRCSRWRARSTSGVSGWVLQHNEAQLVNDMLNDPRGALVPGTEWEPQACIIAPLTLGDKAIGVLALDRMGERTFDEHELEPVTLFANLAAIAIHNARQYEEAEKASKQLAEQLALSHELLSASGAVLSSLEQTEVLEHIADTLKQIVDYDAMDVRLVDAERRTARRPLRPRRGRRAGDLRLRHPHRRRHQRLGRPPQRGAARQRHGSRPARGLHPGHGAGRDAGLDPRPALRRRRGHRRHDHGPPRGRTFEGCELEPARLFANLAAIAIRNARQYDELETTSAQLESQLALQHELLDLSTILLSTLDLREVFRAITSMLKDIVDYDAMDIRMLDEETRELVCIYSRDKNAEINEQFRISLDEGVGGWVVRHDEAQLVNDMAHDPRVVHVPGTDEDEPQACIVVPLARARHGHRRALAGPDGRPRLRRARARAGQAVRQPGGHRHPERAHLRGDGAAGHQRRPHRHPQLPALPRVAQRARSAAPGATTSTSAC